MNAAQVQTGDSEQGQSEPSWPGTFNHAGKASYLLADSAVVLAEYEFAFSVTYLLWSKKDYTLPETSLTFDEATLWNEEIAPHLRASIESGPLNPEERRTKLAALFESNPNLTGEAMMRISAFLHTMWKIGARAHISKLLRYTMWKVGARAHISKLLRLNASELVPTARNGLAETHPLQDWRRLWLNWVVGDESAKFRERKRIAEEEAARQRVLQEERERVEALERAQAQEEAARQRVLQEERERRDNAAKAEYKLRLATTYVKTAESKEWAYGDTPLTESVRRNLECEYVQEWFTGRKSSQVSVQPNADQIAAISRMSSRLLIQARAGSGKTTLLVMRTIFLIQHCKVDPHHIILFVFNKKAAVEIETRLIEALGLVGAPEDQLRSQLPFVQTFDAFAQACSNWVNWEDYEREDLFFNAIQTLISDRPDAVRDAMKGLFQRDWERLEAAFIPGREATLSTRRSYEADGLRETLGGEQVKSLGEHRIANYLFENDIPYKYEKPLYKTRIKHWSPDFTLFPELDPQERIIVEYLGLAGIPEYDLKTASKKDALYGMEESLRPTVIWLLPADMVTAGESNTRYKETILKALAERRLQCQPLSEDEIWARIKVRAVSTFREVMISVAERAMQLNWGGSELQNAASGSPVPELLGLAAAVLANVQENPIEGKRSYAEICWDAAGALNASNFSPPSLHWKASKLRQELDLTSLREILIDEYQDYAPRFSALVEGLITRSPETRVVAVGDDWQAINRYAGSDSKYIETAAREYSRVLLPMNHRSRKEIVELGNSLMEGHGPAATSEHGKDPANIYKFSIDQLKIDPLEKDAVEKYCDLYPNIPVAISRLAIPHLRKGNTVAVLARTNPELAVNNRNQHKRTPLTAMLSEMAGTDTGLLDVGTAHSYKGLQADVVILLTEKFPLLHSHRVITEVFGDTEEVVRIDERRLLYVALTRAKHTLYILVRNQSEEQEFISELKIPPGSWDEFPPTGTHMESQEKLLILVSRGSYQVRFALKQDGFTFKDQPQKHWQKIEHVLRDPLAIVEELKRRPWATSDALTDDLYIEVRNRSKDLVASAVIRAKAGNEAPGVANATSQVEPGTSAGAFTPSRELEVRRRAYEAGARSGSPRVTGDGEVIAALPAHSGNSPRVRIPGERYFRDGDRVQHPRFGSGIVVTSKLTRSDEEVTIAFVGLGMKTLAASVANLELL